MLQPYPQAVVDVSSPFFSEIGCGFWGDFLLQTFLMSQVWASWLSHRTGTQSSHCNRFFLLGFHIFLIYFFVCGVCLEEIFFKVNPDISKTIFLLPSHIKRNLAMYKILPTQPFFFKILQLLQSCLLVKLVLFQKPIISAWKLLRDF